MGGGCQEGRAWQKKKRAAGPGSGEDPWENAVRGCPLERSLFRGAPGLHDFSIYKAGTLEDQGQDGPVRYQVRKDLISILCSQYRQFSHPGTCSSI